MARILVALLILTSTAVAADLDRPPIAYSTAKTQNLVSQLEAKLKAQPATFTYDSEHGYLQSLLKEFQVPVSSQVLVFSKTSLQRSRIGPKTPRAIYFNDEVTVGICRGGDVLEVAAADPNLGTVFYTLDQDPDKPSVFTRHTESCLICHGSSSNQGMPGHLIRSVTPNRWGEPVLSLGTKRVDHSTPFEDRWGGWYVTGTHGQQTHKGNRINGEWAWADPAHPPQHDNVTNLKPYFTVANYLSPHSDLVALMVLEHQGEAHNRLTRCNFTVRLALHEQAELNKAFNEPSQARLEGITKRIQWACEPVVQYLLFSDEAKLTAPVAGTSTFAQEFAKRGPFDPQGRSLREFDLKTRMFRYPLSYTIYSKLFDGLPPEAKERIYRRLWEVLSGQDQSKEFAHLSPADRTAIRGIVLATKANLPSYWHEGS